MKTKKVISFLIVLVIILSMGLVFTTIKLINTKQVNTNTSSENNIKKNIVQNNLVKPEPEVNAPSGDNQLDEDIELAEGKEPVIEKKDEVKYNKVDPVVKPKENGDKDIINPPLNQDNKVKGIDEEKNPKDNNDKNKDNKNNKKNDKSILDNSIISEDSAIKIALKKVGSGGKLEKISSRLDDNPPKYYLEVLKNKHKYSIEIHARTGAVLEHEKKKIKD